ncbi:MAG: hypothetical protein MUP85_19430 [Candidatus Lokiarchaeota archaeon]|nr:hypothetical protein [Candidatus Lokiarchaeota archaeon]
MDLEEYNSMFQNDCENINSLKGLEIICESMVNKVYDLFGRNALLSMLFHIGSGPGNTIANRIKEIYEKEEFEVLDAFAILVNELKDYYSIVVREIEDYDDKIRLVIENHCFLREPIKHREGIKFGKAFCRVNKGYFETAFKNLLGTKIIKIDINFLYNDEEKDVCVEELNFYKNNTI